jgi:hypothetical protein
VNRGLRAELDRVKLELVQKETFIAENQIEQNQANFGYAPVNPFKSVIMTRRMSRERRERRRKNKATKSIVNPNARKVKKKGVSFKPNK